MAPSTQYHFVVCGRISTGSYGRDCGAGYGATRGAEKSAYATGASPAGSSRSGARGRQEPAYPSGSDVPQEGAAGSAAKVNPSPSNAVPAPKENDSPLSASGGSQAPVSSASDHPDGAPSEGSKEPEPTHSETPEGAPHSPAESALGPSEGEKNLGSPSTSEESAHAVEHGGESEIKGQENGIEAGVEQPTGNEEAKKETGQAADGDALEQRQAIEVPASSIDQ
ncbi:unnamed protein product [Toxocara canis]|uniref:Toxoplasma gondii family A protein n=1 Tax=Toxocara canis TaxID=6265 RepID=A0A183U2G7_TOXCA|nr:unnamed protein product [Toxocara canis]